MAYRIEFLDEAKRECHGILEYLARVLKNPQAAAAFADELEHQVSLIADNPTMRELSRVPALAARGYRVRHVNNYAMLYTIRQERIFIAHIFHQSQDYAKLL